MEFKEKINENSINVFIDGFGISSYRSFGSDIQLIGPCNKINFFIGQNNSGKSNILFKNALSSAGGLRSNAFNLSELDQHLGENVGRIQIAFGLKRNGLLQETLFENHDPTRPRREIRMALDRVN